MWINPVRTNHSFFSIQIRSRSHESTWRGSFDLARSRSHTDMGVSHSRVSITMATGWSVEETKALLGAWGATDVQSQLARNRRHTPAIDHSILTLIIIINPLQPIAAKCGRQFSIPLQPIAAKCARGNMSNANSWEHALRVPDVLLKVTSLFHTKLTFR